MAARKKQPFDVAGAVEHLLAGFSATTLFRGARLGQSDVELIAALGPPAEHRPDDDLGGRRVFTVRYAREVTLGGHVMREAVDFSGDVQPSRTSLTSVAVLLLGNADAAKDLSATFTAVKLALAERYAPGDNKSTFRARDFSSEAEGFIAVYFHKPRPPLATDAVLKLTAGIVV